MRQKLDLATRKNILQLTVPVFVEQAFIMMLGVVNTIMAGHLGKEILSAIGMIDAINNIVIAFFSAVAIGGTVVAARYFASRQKELAQNTALNAIIATVLLAIIVTMFLSIFKLPLLEFIYGDVEPDVFENAVIYFKITLLTYPLLALTFMVFGLLRGSGNTKSPMKVSLMMNVINVILGYVLIFGLEFRNAHFDIVFPSLGIYGAAYAIAIARTCGALMALYALLKHVITVRWSELRAFRFDLGILKKVFGIGLPSGMESMIFNAGKFVLQVVVVSYGTTSMAASTVLWSLFGLINVPGTAIAIASTTLVSQALGRGDKESARPIIFYLTKAGIVTQGLISLPFLFFTAQFIGFYTQEADVIELATGILRTLVIIMPFIWAHSFIVPQGLKGGGDVKFTLGISVVSMWVFRVAVGYLLGSVFGLGLPGLWIGMYVDWIARGVLFTWRVMGEKWIRF